MKASRLIYLTIHAVLPGLFRFIFLSCVETAQTLNSSDNVGKVFRCNVMTRWLDLSLLSTRLSTARHQNILAFPLRSGLIFLDAASKRDMPMEAAEIEGGKLQKAPAIGGVYLYRVG